MKYELGQVVKRIKTGKLYVITAYTVWHSTLRGQNAAYGLAVDENSLPTFWLTEKQLDKECRQPDEQEG